MWMTAYAFLNIEEFVVAWEVYCGVMISTNETITDSGRPMSVFEVGRFRNNDAVWYTNELIMDAVRLNNHPTKISRLTGMYFFEDRESAMRIIGDPRWRSRHFTEEFLTEVELHPTGQITRVDHNWIFEKQVLASPIDEDDMTWIDDYWEGNPVPNKLPHWELIVEGSAIILDESVKSRAFKIIKNRQPRTLVRLEKSKAKRQRGSQYGHIVAWVTPTEDVRKGKVVYIIKGVEKDISNLPPDLRNEFFDIALSDNPHW